MKLYTYWRSLATFRVRIALNLKSLKYEAVYVDLDGGQQNKSDYKTVNPQMVIPSLVEDDGNVLYQSLAIMEYLDETYSGAMSLLPSSARERARVRALAQLVACDIHPLNNLRVMQFLEREFSTPQVERERWTRHWIIEGFNALERMLAENSSTGIYCDGDAPTIADACLVPQVYNARRFGIDMQQFPTIAAIERQCLGMPAFDAAKPENQPDAPPSSP